MSVGQRRPAVSAVRVAAAARMRAMRIKGNRKATRTAQAAELSPIASCRDEHHCPGVLATPFGRFGLLEEVAIDWRRQ